VTGREVNAAVDGTFVAIEEVGPRHSPPGIPAIRDVRGRASRQPVRGQARSHRAVRSGTTEVNLLEPGVLDVPDGSAFPSGCATRIFRTTRGGSRSWPYALAFTALAALAMSRPDARLDRIMPTVVAKGVRAGALVRRARRIAA
jgi:hypothetical protein